ncbi:MAG TPA: MaoC/PaaZ C-terminal domain-containing protein [Marinobacter sp.]|nr:MaoC/PaaZ C-terminal domain-containing protein [Marinobacter sp.]
MPGPLVYHRTPPALMPLYAKAIWPKSGKAKGEIAIPDLSAKLIGTSTAGNKLARYQAVCGIARNTSVPLAWPHIMAFPLQLRLLTDSAFPLPLLGLVHLRNTITQHREIGIGEILDITVRFGKQESTRRGLEFDLITEAWAAGKLVWEESSITLFRQPKPVSTTSSNKREGKKQPPELVQYPDTLSIEAPESIGRQYAKVSGDSNPIHMHALSAKAFGFPRAIAHGMWSKARAIALMAQQDGWKPGPMKVTCQFKKPLLLPGQAQLNWQAGESGWEYQLLNAKGDAPHLSGYVEWL